ncbi:MAG: WD40/YVTN/BNR-like repeat-containing protein, partial [Gemmatimonadaceae bacterium]
MRATLPRLERGLVCGAAVALGNACGGGGGANDSAGPDGGDACGNAIGNGAQVVAGPAAPNSQDPDQVFRSLAIHPSNPDIVYVGTERNGVVRSTDGGRTWTRLRNGIRHAEFGYPEVWDLALSPTNPARVVAATVDSPGPATGDYPSSIAGVYGSTDGGATWSRANCGLTNSSVAAVAFDRLNPSAIVIGLNAGRATFSALAGQFFAGGLFRSSDDGRAWTPVGPSGADRGSHWQITTGISGAAAFMLAYSLDLDAPVQSRGFLRSQDGGATWTPLPNTLAGRYIAEFDASVDGRVIYASERTPHRLLRSLDAGLTWQTLTAPGTEPVAVSPGDPQIVLLHGSQGVFRSVNGATSWRLVL